MIEAKQRPGVPLIPAAPLADWIHRWHAHISVYQVPKCTGSDRRVIQPVWDDYGITPGIKALGDCRPTVEQIADSGYRFVICSTDQITRAYVRALHHYGLRVGNFDSGQETVWAHLATVGADYLLAPHPARAVRWLS
jgi:hypothetical protein